MAECVNDSDAESRISYGDYVVLKRGDVFKSVQVENKKKVVFEKQWFFLDHAVGQLYGTRFEIEAGGSLKLKAAKHTGDSLDSKEAGQDNRHIVDDGRSQKLTRDDIETLKEQGLKGQHLYSIVNIFVYFSHLRYDTLAQILTLGNIHAGSKIIVFETCAGLVLGSVMERMGGFGSVIQMYPGGGPTRAGMESFGFPLHFHETLHEFPLCKVNALLAGSLDLSEKDADSEANGSRNGQSEPSQETSGVSEEKSSEPQSMEVSVDPQEEMRRAERERLRGQKAQEKKVKMEEKRKKLASAAALLQSRNADGLVIASRFDPCPVSMGLLKFVAPSRPFVVYCQYREPLIECYTKLREQGGAISLRLTDSWLRHYQVLPNRTHPVLLMSGGGGYLLSGTTVAADAAKARNQHKSEEPVAKRLKLDEISSA
ncbi:tRNA (adenine(58)-N(1))-methyltransferase non-catalytic subunit TRM6-like [Sinocyclocheilus rhinocerous]|uniref:tRNA (adenine(58)-N(1))-methyltransferase non-catalytic subunit TRM6 n=1 Tax=Sinocyclocheilus rhinocerous TaxID=307959 RepID=A0A673J2H5_9TELE|nr:PREDICTED: tRNA (adenine(58)-N(1))-methyltransferase non-catalytic subunit TRM6-like [Sinocyclocheilus rhinocerous]